jgi:hypothetical protein
VATKVASVFAEIGADTSGLVKGVQNAMRNLNDLAKEFQKLTGISAGGALAIAGVGTALIAVGKFAIDAMKETQAYNLSIVDTARVMGTTTEEASKLVQVGDDVRLSQEQIKQAMVIAAKNGIEPTIEGMARLSDKYLALAPGVERDQLLLQSFGRSGADMGKLLEKGGDGIRSMADSIEKGLIVTQQAAIQSQRYYASVDRLNDAWTAFKMNVGNTVIPVLTDIMVKNEAARMTLEQLGPAASRAGTGFSAEYKALLLVNETLLKYGSSSGVVTDETGFLKNALDQVIPPTKEEEEQVRALSKDFADAARTAGHLYERLFDLSGISLDLSADIATNIEKAAMVAAGGPAVQGAMANVDEMFQKGIIGFDTYVAKQKEFAIISAKTALDAGQDFKKVGQSMASAMGIPLSEAYGLLKKIQAGIIGMDGLSAQIWVDVFYRSHGVVPSGQNTWQPTNIPAGVTNIPHATGANFTVPAGYQGDNYPILAKTGERVNIKPAGQPEVGMNELLAAIKRLPSQIGVSVRDAVLTS